MCYLGAIHVESLYSSVCVVCACALVKQWMVPIGPPVKEISLVGCCLSGKDEQFLQSVFIDALQ